MSQSPGKSHGRASAGRGRGRAGWGRARAGRGRAGAGRGRARLTSKPFADFGSKCPKLRIAFFALVLLGQDPQRLSWELWGSTEQSAELH